MFEYNPVSKEDFNKVEKLFFSSPSFGFEIKTFFFAQCRYGDAWEDIPQTHLKTLEDALEIIRENVKIYKNESYQWRVVKRIFMIPITETIEDVVVKPEEIEKSYD
jgi:hypothetical protein